MIVKGATEDKVSLPSLLLCDDTETLLALLPLCEGNQLVTGGFPYKGTIIVSFEVFLIIVNSSQFHSS